MRPFVLDLKLESLDSQVGLLGGMVYWQKLAALI